MENVEEKQTTAQRIEQLRWHRQWWKGYETGLQKILIALNLDDKDMKDQPWEVMVLLRDANNEYIRLSKQIKKIKNAEEANNGN
tara:strand:+ start:2343 stop:2594 length:252 start_codon:yes stop_codon:yes gene_type:complete